MVDQKKEQPFFTIGVTTYKRRELLKQTLTSLLAQSFTDFEVIVGNDYPQESLTCELFDINDSRIHFVNHPVNLQEVGNMNELLAMASGRYFTWLADDDLYEPDFLQRCHDILLLADFPPVVFTSYRIFHGTGTPPPRTKFAESVCELSGRDFLNRFFKGGMRIIGVYGLFETDRLKGEVKGVEELCTSGVGLYGEYIFLVRCALFDKIIYSDAPLILYRGHEGSWTATNVELDKYLVAGQELIRRSGEVLRHPKLADDLDNNLSSLCRVHLTTFAVKCAAHEIAHEKSGIGMVLRAMKRFSEEAEKIRQLFISQGGKTVSRKFIWMYLIGYYKIIGMLIADRLRKL